VPFLLADGGDFVTVRYCFLITLLPFLYGDSLPHYHDFTDYLHTLPTVLLRNLRLPVLHTPFSVHSPTRAHHRDVTPRCRFSDADTLILLRYTSHRCLRFTTPPTPLTRYCHTTYRFVAPFGGCCLRSITVMRFRFSLHLRSWVLDHARFYTCYHLPRYWRFYRVIHVTLHGDFTCHIYVCVTTTRTGREISLHHVTVWFTTRSSYVVGYLMEDTFSLIHTLTPFTCHLVRFRLHGGLRSHHHVAVYRSDSVLFYGYGSTTTFYGSG